MKILTWEQMEREVANRLGVKITESNLYLGEEDCVIYEDEEEVITVAKDIRDDDHSIGYVLEF